MLHWTDSTLYGELMEQYQSLLQKTLTNFIDRKTHNDKGVYNLLSKAIRSRVSNGYPEATITPYLNIDYGYYDIPRVSIMGIKIDSCKLIPGQSRILDTLQAELDKDYFQYVHWFKQGTWDVIMGYGLNHTLYNLLEAHRTKDIAKFNELMKVAKQNIIGILAETDGPEVPPHSIVIPLLIDYDCPVDEWPPLSLGTGRIILQDGKYLYLNNDITSQNITFLFEQIKEKIYNNVRITGE